MVTDIVSEKENRIKEAMKTMGLLDGPYWISFFSVTFVMSIGPLLLITGVSNYVITVHHNYVQS